MRSRKRPVIYVEGDEAAARFDRTLKHVLGISKQELAKREDAYRKSREHRPHRGPKPSSSSKK